MRPLCRARRAPQPPWSRREQEEKARVFVVVEQIKTIGVCWTIANPAVFIQEVVPWPTHLSHSAEVLVRGLDG